MKERPILFSSEMVKAILDGRKTQTRRVIKPQPNFIRWNSIVLHKYAGWTDEHGTPFPCPYGQPGDELWVRETWWKIPTPSKRDWLNGADTWPEIAYPADDDHPSYYGWGWRKKPSIHMKREHSRIQLRVKDVRVERVQGISREDLLAEGIDDGCGNRCGEIAAQNWKSLWDSINASRGYNYDSNPWVWVICFERIKP